MKLTVDIQGLPQLREALRDLSQRRLAAGVATGLTRTAVQVRDAQRQAMTQVFDRPTPWTLNGLWLQPATGNEASAGSGFLPGLAGTVAGTTRFVRSRYLEAQVFLKDESAGSGTPASVYLQPQIEGGSRQLKRLEKLLYARGVLPAGWRIVPGQSARLDAYGNVSRGQIKQVFSQLRLDMVSGSTSNMSFTPAKQLRAVRRAGGRYFVMPVGRSSKLPPGIYQREWFVRAVGAIFIFVRSTNYRPRFDFFGIAQRIAAANLEANVTTALAEQLQRAQAAAASR